MAAEVQELGTTQGRGVTIEFRFPLGRYHATAMGTAANDGVVEWPPSPWRILRALYSVWKTRCADLTDEQVLPVLDALAAPPEYRLPDRSGGGHTRHYMPGEKSGEPTTFLALDAFITCAPSEPLVAWWRSANLNDEQRRTLARLCDELTWLGRAESLCDALLVDPEEQVQPNAAPVLDDTILEEADFIRLLVPERPLNESALTVHLETLRSNAKSRATTPPASTYVTYRRPLPSLERPMARPHRRRRITALRFELTPTANGRRTPRLPMRDLLLYTNALRRAAQSRLGSTSPALSGHIGDEQATGHAHAHYLALPARRGRSELPWIGSLLVWAPGGFDEDEEAALRGITRLFGFEYISEFRAINLACAGVGEITKVVPTWLTDATTPSRVWESVTPVVPGRHPKGQRSWADQIRIEVAQAVQERSLPAGEISLERWTGGFRTSRPGTSRKAHPHPHRVTLTFETPLSVEGPLTLGALSHFGLGLFRPAS